MLTRYPDLECELKLDFAPIVNDRPAALTRGQIEQFNERGFIDPVRLFEGEELRRMQRFFLEEGRELSALSLHQTEALPHDVSAHRRTAAYLRDLLGPNVVCHISQFINKPPGQSKGGSHHQDASFNAMDARCVIVWLAIADADVENGCMWFVPGSHRQGLVECDKGHFVVDPLKYGAEQPVPAKAGEAIIFSDLVFHSSPANRSKDRYRPAFTSTYAAAEVRPFKDANRWAVMCCGADVKGYWKVHGRPIGAGLR